MSLLELKDELSFLAKGYKTREACALYLAVRVTMSCEIFMHCLNSSVSVNEDHLFPIVLNGVW